MPLFAHVQTVYIVAGGPSLRDLNWDLLHDKVVIAVNNAHLKLPNAKIVYFSDYRYFQLNKKTLQEHTGIKISVTDLARREFPKWVKVYKFQHRFGLDIVPDYICPGNDSGYAAINVAVKHGAKEIHLMGYDFNHDAEGNDHWHDKHPHGTVLLRTLQEKMLPYYRYLNGPLQAMGVRVYNTNPNSELRLFKQAKRIDKT